ncbi:ABC transporter ATP-binding protein [Microvirga alba]|uniref:ATP-binding cassette domain-containing protein n=1 Tax=Microvirga alba TaxID=2791025 RepID=A0A931FP26_9HYPH|nr:ABC transporter ATP-binding protein [Microvirga alba]MBF9231983.1 ATP-binding cassette domain-containing protein [Microvirga alba]
MSRAIAITCSGVSKRFALVDQGSAWRLAFSAHSGVPVFEALKNINFEVPKGQFVGFLGRNGAGKSTLLRTIGGVYSADGGQIAIKGKLSGLYELGLVGNPQLTGRQYAERLLTIHGEVRRRQQEMIADIHEFSELGDRFEDPVFTYSAGMSARLFFSTATAGSYDVYLLDEVLAVGDQHFQAKCWRRLRDRVSRGASGVLVTHDWAAIVKMCETAHVIDRGQIIFSGPAANASRYHLYGEDAKETFEPGIARFVARPEDPMTARPGQDLVIRAEAEIMQPANVGAVAVIERLQPGFGWETELMSREITPVGQKPGRYMVEVRVPHLPIERGSYQISLHLVMPDPKLPGRRVALDGFSWLNGDGLRLEVEDPLNREGLTLPVRWKVACA